MDTDSAYMAVSNASIAQLVHEDAQESYYREYGEWSSRLYCAEHKADFRARRTQLSDLPEYCIRVCQYDSRTPGLFKEEFREDGVVALNS